MGVCHPERVLKEVDEELERRDLPCLMSILANIPQAERKDIKTIIDLDELKKYTKDNLGMHGFFISHYGTIVVLTDYLVSKLQKYID